MSNDRIPSYKTYVDWHGHGGLTLGLANWYTSNTTGTPDSVIMTTTEWYRSGQSIRVENGEMYRRINAVAGEQMTLKLWTMIPVDSTYGNVIASVLDGNGTMVTSSTMNTIGAWTETTLTFTRATDEALTLHLNPGSGGSGVQGPIFYIGWVQVTTAVDEVTCDVLTTRQVPDIAYGRDSARDLAEIRAGGVTLALNNENKKYTPGNNLSPISNYLKPNRPVMVEAHLDGKSYTLFTGYTENYVLQAYINEKSVEISCVDLLGKLSGVTVTTELHDSIRTGDAINEILSLTDYYKSHEPPYVAGTGTTLFDPFLHHGASTLRWWGYHGDAFTGMQEIIDSEGPPSLLFIGESGQIVFYDRVHRQRSDYTVPEVTITGGCDVTTEIVMDGQSAPDYGWTEVANVINTTYSRNHVAGTHSRVWEQPGDQSFDGQHKFTGQVESGYYDAQDPVFGEFTVIHNPGPDELDVLGAIEPEEYDAILVDGEVTLDNMKRSGIKVEIVIDDETATGVYSKLRDLGIRARAVETESTPIEARHATSIEAYGGERTLDLDVGPVPEADAQAITDLVLVKSALRRPTVTVVLRNHNLAHANVMLQARLSQLLRITNDYWEIDDLFTIEAIEHSLSESGADHTTVLHLQQVMPAIEGAGAFTFDDPALGFDDGHFATSLPADQVVLTLPGLDGAFAYTDFVSIPGDLDIRARITPAVWARGTKQTIIASRRHHATFGSGWQFYVDESGYLAFFLETSGTMSTPAFTFDDPSAGFDEGVFTGKVQRVHTSSVAVPTPYDVVVRVSVEEDTGGTHTVTFYTGPTVIGPWTVLDTSVQSPDINLVSNGSLTSVGASNVWSTGALNTTEDEFAGTIHSVYMHAGLNGPEAANPVFADQPIGTLGFTDDAGKAWKMHGGAAIVGDGPTFIIGESALDGPKVLAY